MTINIFPPEVFPLKLKKKKYLTHFQNEEIFIFFDENIHKCSLEKMSRKLCLNTYGHSYDYISGIYKRLNIWNKACLGIILLCLNSKDACAVLRFILEFIYMEFRWSWLNIRMMVWLKLTIVFFLHFYIWY